MIISALAVKYGISKMYGFYSATLYTAWRRSMTSVLVLSKETL